MEGSSQFSTHEEVLTAADGGRFIVTMVNPRGQQRAPVVYLPGMFTGRGFWLSDRGVGLAGYLAAEGFPGVIVQRREADCGARAGLDEHLRYDLPLVQRRAAEAWQRPAFWVGHSFGGVLAARAVAEVLDPARVLGLILFAAQFEVAKRPLYPPFSWLTRAAARAFGQFPARRLGLGPRDEPPAAIDDAAQLVTAGRRRPDIRTALSRVAVPVLAISGLGDRTDPTRGCEKLVGHFASDDRRFVAAGRRTGFQLDYDHAGIVVSKPAQREIWPLTREWLIARDSHARGKQVDRGS